MNCQFYLDLSPQEKVEMIGKITHALQCDPDIFEEVKALIWVAETKGIFNGVVINPPSTAPEINNDKNETP